jgi:hypothetical protein
MNSRTTAADGLNADETSRNLTSIRPFFIVKNLQASIACGASRSPMPTGNVLAFFQLRDE